MTKEFSVYLDIVRFVAACLVVLHHSNARNVIEVEVPLSGYGHAAVIVFFVLSGYVIAFVSETKERTFKEYWSSRLSRIYSLAVPAVILTPLLDLAGESLNASFYVGNTTHDFWIVRTISSLVFMNEAWFFSIMCFSNLPYWSLNYEMWYYVLFSVYAVGNFRRRAFIGALVCLIVGPKILLLAPIWILGVILYRYQPAYRISEMVGWLAVFSSILLFGIFDRSSVADDVASYLTGFLGVEWMRQLTFSKWFLTDYLFASIVFLNFVGVRRVGFRLSSPVRLLEPLVRFLASYTFSIYMFHAPLLYFFAAALSMSPVGYEFYALVMLCTFATILVLGTYTERKRFRLKALFRAWLERIEASRIWRERVWPLFAK